MRMLWIGDDEKGQGEVAESYGESWRADKRRGSGKCWRWMGFVGPEQEDGWMGGWMADYWGGRAEKEATATGESRDWEKTERG
jgi:hypothetical protein